MYLVSFVYSLWWSLNFAIIYWGVQQRFRESKLCKVFPSFCPGVKAATCDTQWSLLIAILCFTAMERRIFAIHSCLWCQTWNFGCPEKRTKTTYVAKMSLILWILQVFLYLFAKQRIFIFTFKYQRLLFFCRYDLYMNSQFVEIKQSKLVNRHSSSFKPN